MPCRESITQIQEVGREDIVDTSIPLELQPNNGINEDVCEITGKRGQYFSLRKI